MAALTAIPGVAWGQRTQDPLLGGDGPFAAMQMILEKTFLRVDVLTLEVRVDRPTAERIRSFAEGKRYSEELADSVTAAVLGARAVVARIRFLRNVSSDQFVDGVTESMETAVKAGLLEQAAFDQIAPKLPIWYSFLDSRGIRIGDEQVYRVSANSLRTTFTDNRGSVLFDQTDVGPAGPRAVLASYFAPRSDFRRPLVRSMVR
jgi:hypothetical protein